jgi:hypothetical protein
MVSLRAVGAFLLVGVALVVGEPLALLGLGLVAGAVTAALADPGGRSGLLHGLLIGACCTGLLWAGLAA